MPHHHHNFLYTRVHGDLNAVPKDVKTIIFAMFVYMIGWGIFDPFMSVLIHNVTQSYSLAGLLYGLFCLVGIGFSVPMGDLAGKINKISFTKKAILAYPFVGLLYFSLAFFSSGLAVVVLFIARTIHGFASLLWIPVADFIRERAPRGQTAATFGLHMTFHRLTYVIAPIFLIPIVLLTGLTIENIHWLALLLVPFPILAAVLLSRIKDKGESLSQGVEEVIVKDGIFRKELQDLKKLGFVGYFTLLIGFFMRALLATVFFLIPLYALSLNLGLIEISILFAIINFPYLFSFFLAELSDRFGKMNLIAIGFALAALTFLGIYLFSSIIITFFIACFFLGFILALLQPAVNGLITDITPRVQDGEMTGMLEAVLKISGFVTALALGILSDAFNLQFPFLVFAILLLAMAAITYSLKGKVVVRI